MSERMEQILSELLQEVKLLTVTTKAVALQRFKADFLTSEQRKQAYELFDGTKTLKEISELINAKLNTLQVFAQQLVQKDLVDVVKQGNNRMISKSVSKIAVYYAELDLNSEDMSNG